MARSRLTWMEPATSRTRARPTWPRLHGGGQQPPRLPVDEVGADPHALALRAVRTTPPSPGQIPRRRRPRGRGGGERAAGRRPGLTSAARTSERTGSNTGPTARRNCASTLSGTRMSGRLAAHPRAAGRAAQDRGRGRAPGCAAGWQRHPGDRVAEALVAGERPACTRRRAATGRGASRRDVPVAVDDRAPAFRRRRRSDPPAAPTARLNAALRGGIGEHAGDGGMTTEVSAAAAAAMAASTSGLSPAIAAACPAAAAATTTPVSLGRSPASRRRRRRASAGLLRVSSTPPALGAAPPSAQQCGHVAGGVRQRHDGRRHGGGRAGDATVAERPPGEPVDGLARHPNPAEDPEAGQQGASERLRGALRRQAAPAAAEEEHRDPGGQRATEREDDRQQHRRGEEVEPPLHEPIAMVVHGQPDEERRRGHGEHQLDDAEQVQRQDVHEADRHQQDRDRHQEITDAGQAEAHRGDVAHGLAEVEVGGERRGHRAAHRCGDSSRRRWCTACIALSSSESSRRRGDEQTGGHQRAGDVVDDEMKPVGALVERRRAPRVRRSTSWR